MLLASTLPISAGVLAAVDPNNSPIDWDYTRQLFQKSNNGQSLTPEEQAYLDRAKVAHQAGQGPGTASRNASASRPGRGAGGAGPTSMPGLVPLDEMIATDWHKGEDGGLYGGGLNQPTGAHLDAARKELARIVPLDANGEPSPGGRIVLISIGMSNTTGEFQLFKKLADQDPAKSAKVIIVDCAQGGKDAATWARSDNAVWNVTARNLSDAHVAPKQVQAVWLKHALVGVAMYGEFPKHTEVLKEDLISILNIARRQYPNLRVAYLSSRIYGAYTNSPPPPVATNPEPYAYEGAFAVRWVIQEQIKGDKRLNYDPAKGDVAAPLVLWGPYLWANGVTPRKSDGLTYQRDDLVEDGVHPSPTGRQKVAGLLLTFFRTDPLARDWFAAPGAASQPVSLPPVTRPVGGGTSTSRPGDAMDGNAWRADWISHLFPKGSLDGTCIGLTPLCDMDANDRYKGEDGGLYGGGSNRPPSEHLAKAIKAAKGIQPLGSDGKPDANGKIVFISIGMSNTTGEFRHLIRYLAERPITNQSPAVTLVDCALGMCTTDVWSGARILPARTDPVHPYGTDPWVNLDAALNDANVSRQQVQVAWLKNTRAIGAPNNADKYTYLAWPEWSDEMKKQMVVIVTKLKRTLPNLRIIYLSTRTYAGYATVGLNPEPYAYETAFVDRWLILQQIAGDKDLAYETAPVLLWGPYFWADGTRGRKIDDLKWVADDFERDGTHPKNGEHNQGKANLTRPVGADKVIKMIMDFLATDPTAKIWFLRE